MNRPPRDNPFIPFFIALPMLVVAVIIGGLGLMRVVGGDGVFELKGILAWAPAAWYGMLLVVGLASGIAVMTLHGAWRRWLAALVTLTLAACMAFQIAGELQLMLVLQAHPEIADLPALAESTVPVPTWAKLTADGGWWFYLVMGLWSLGTCLACFRRQTVNHFAPAEAERTETSTLIDRLIRTIHDNGYSILLPFPLGLVGAWLIGQWFWLYYWGTRAASIASGTPGGFDDPKIASGVWLLSWIVGMGAVVMVLSALTALLWRSRWTLGLLRMSWIAAYIILLMYSFVAGAAVDRWVAHETGADKIVLDANGLPPVNVDIPTMPARDVVVAALPYLFWAWLIGLFFVLCHVISAKRSVLCYYHLTDPPDIGRGDTILENIRTHGRDPRYRKASAISVFCHAVFLLGPVLALLVMNVWGCRQCVKPYNVPEGSGQPAVMAVQVVKKKKKKQKRYFRNPNASIILNVPTLDESEIEKEVDAETQETYQANPNAMAGKMGAGGGTEGGWPEGTGRDPIRLIRLQYYGQGWDDGMGKNKGNADANFLAFFEKDTGFKTENRSEFHSALSLKDYPKGHAPPVIYMTGAGDVRMSRAEMKALRDYLIKDGGMLFADAGYHRFDRSFRRFVDQVFAGDGKKLRVIADDDPLYQLPHRLPNGAPPLWHHGGNRALGIKHNGRWVVYYHPGDVNDAWKDGNSGADATAVKESMQLGVNIFYYAFTNYLRHNREYLKK